MDSATKKWFKDQAGRWHSLTADGGVYQWSKEDGEQLVGGVALSYFFKPNDLVIDY